jgi:hypothetical protein
VRLSDGAQVDFGEEFGSFPVSERTADEPEDFSDEEEPVDRQEVSADDSSDDGGYKGGRVVAGKKQERRSTFPGGPWGCLRSGLLVALRAATGKRTPPIFGGGGSWIATAAAPRELETRERWVRVYAVNRAIGLIFISLLVRE